jgi:hypothetical protein
MAWKSISGTVPQYEVGGIPASGYYLKFYAAGTTTAIVMAIDETGSTTLAKAQLNSEGFPINGSSAVFIPHINRRYKLALYTNAIDADADTLGNAAWVVDLLSAEDHDNVATYDLGSEAAAASHTGVSTGSLIKTDYYDTNRTLNSGGDFSYTGTTTLGKATNWPDTDGYFYDADGKQFALIGTASPKQFGAVGGGATATAAVLATFAGSKFVVIDDHYAIEDDYIQLTQTTTVTWNGDGKIEQKGFAYPGFHVKAPACTMIGRAHVTNTGTPATISASVVPEITADYKQTSAAFILQGTAVTTTRADYFSFDVIRAEGFVNGVTFVGSNVGTNKTFNTSGALLDVDDVDFGIFGAGFNGVDIETVSGTNLRNSQNEPEHLIYTTGSVASRSAGLRIGKAVVDVIEFGTHALLIKGTDNFNFGYVRASNTAGIVAVFWSTGVFNTILGTLSPVAGDASDVNRSGIIISETSSVDILESPIVTSTTAGVMFQVDVTSTVTCYGFDGTIDNAAPTNPVKCRGGATLTLLNRPKITYTQTQPALPHSAFLGEGTDTIFNLEDPECASDRVVRMTMTGTGDYTLKLNPDLYPYSRQEFVATTIVAKAQFGGYMQGTATIVDGDVVPKIRAHNVLTTSNSTAKSITAFVNGNENQKFLVKAGDANTTLVHGATIVMQGAANLTPGWIWAEFVYINDVSYEIANG